MSAAGIEPPATIRPPPEGSPTDPISSDTAFMILKNQRRRDVLRYLARKDEIVTLDSLARHIAAKENGIDEHALSSSQRKRVYIGLYQAHLPKMDDAGVVSFDKHRGRIELRPEAEHVLEYLRLTDLAHPSPVSYLAGSLTIGILTAIATVGWVEVPGLPWVVVFAIAACAVHATQTNRVPDWVLTSPGLRPENVD